MQEFIDSFNYTPLWGVIMVIFIALISIFGVMFMLFTIIYSLTYSYLEKKEKYTIITIILMLITVCVTSSYINSKQIHHINDVKDNYNITINNNLVSFDIKKSNIALNNKQTFIVSKENDKYKLENIERPYQTFILTKDEFSNIFKPKYQTTNSLDIKSELNL